jgi:hypothetical protein
MTCTHARFRDASSPIPLTPRATDIAPAEVNPLDLDGHNRFSAFAAASVPCIPDAIMASLSRSNGPSPKAWSHSLRDRHARLRERFTVFPWSRTCSRGMMHSLYECLSNSACGPRAAMAGTGQWLPEVEDLQACEPGQRLAQSRPAVGAQQVAPARSRSESAVAKAHYSDILRIVIGQGWLLGAGGGEADLKG